MCTLSIVRFNNQTVITSNRDDSPHRNATEIRKINFNNLDIYYPKDQLTNGTWLAFDTSGSVAILLNGCDTKHQKQAHHTKSRGAIPLDFLKKNVDIHQFEKSLNFYNYEPFTLMVYKNHSIATLKWNGNNTKVETIPGHQNQMIWSSATLYEPLIREQRHERFNKYFSTKPVTPAAIFDLLSTPSIDLRKGFYIKRENVQTLSTSQLIIDSAEIALKHRNHLLDKEIILKTSILNELV